MFLRKLLSFILSSFLFSQTYAQTNGKFHVGQKVEIYNIKWYPGYIVSLGTGKYAGDYYVHYDGFSDASNQYMSERNLQLPKVNQADNYNSGPRNGRYIILSYINIYNPTTIGYFDLNNGKYSYYSPAKKLLGTGSYKYDAYSKQVQWLDGLLKAYGASSGFEIDREGKTHKIRLKSGTIGTNSTDSK